MRALTLLLTLFATACWKTDWKPCSPLNCAGCCAEGECLSVPAASACGTGGAECTCVPVVADACTPSCDGRSCGADGCGGSCGACATGACNDSGQCVATCTPSCSGKTCGSDGCGGSCGSCPAGTACDSAGKCQCVPSCMGRQCGPDGCGGACGACGAGQSCTAAGQCQCVPACAGRTCGPDGCGGSCGACSAGSTCSSAGVCVNSCVPESDASFCARLQKQCGLATGLDNCGAPRTSSCGGCASGQSCVANACVGPQRLVFSTSWQVLPGTGSTTVEFRCTGTVTTTATGGTRCFRSQGDPVELRILGTTWLLYPGCDGLRSTNCMTSISPSSATYKDYEVNAGGRLLCDAMGWPLANTLADKNPGTYAADVAVVQTGPAVIGTAQGLKNYGTYVNCEP